MPITMTVKQVLYYVLAILVIVAFIDGALTWQHWEDGSGSIYDIVYCVPWGLCTDGGTPVIEIPRMLNGDYS